MPEQVQIGKRVENGIIYAPWERAFARVQNPFEEYFHRAVVGQDECAGGSAWIRLYAVVGT